MPFERVKDGSAVVKVLEYIDVNEDGPAIENKSN